MSTEKKLRKSSTIKALIINISLMILLVVACAFIALKWLDICTMHGNSVEVPQIKGMKISEAEQLIKKNKLTYTISDSVYRENISHGTIIEVKPEEKSKVKEGREIFITISSNRVPMIEVPDIVDNSSYRQAAAKILALGFKLGEKEEVDGNLDWVYGMKYNERNISAGEKLPKGATIVLLVGSGGNVTDISTNSNESDSKKEQEDNSWF